MINSAKNGNNFYTLQVLVPGGLYFLLMTNSQKCFGQVSSLGGTCLYEGHAIKHR